MSDPTTTTVGLVQYYAGLLIIQYLGKLKAAATIETTVTPVLMAQLSRQTLTFSRMPTSGVYVLSWDGVSSAAINYDDSEATVQTKLRAITGLSALTLYDGGAADFAFRFDSVTPVAPLFVVESNTLDSSGTAVEITIDEIDQTLPLAVENGFNLSGGGIVGASDENAVGTQLDVLGKYAGVSRTGPGFYGQVTLSDADFLSLIRMAIIKNNGGSSLSDIQQLLYDFFPGQVLVFDYQNMRMSYLVSTAVGSAELVQLFITEGVLPKPMGVLLTVIIYAPVIDSFFGFRSYLEANLAAKPFNSYALFNSGWPWLSYANGI